MSDERLAFLIESYLDGTLSAEAREELRALLAADPERRRELARQVRLSRALSTTLAEPTDQRVWTAIAAQLDRDRGEAKRLVAAVDARLDRRRRRPGWTGRWAAGGLAAVAAAAVLVAITAQRSAPPETPARRELARAVAPAAPVDLAPPAARLPAPWIETDEILFHLDPAAFQAARGAGITIRYGRPARCPPGGVARLCFETVRQTGRYTNQGSLTIAAPEAGLFPYADDALLVFDYWLGESIGPRAAHLTSWYTVGAARAGFEIHPSAPAERGRWGHAVFPLSEYRPQPGAIRPGADERVRAFNISCQVQSEDVFFIANLQVVRGRR